MDTNPNPHLEQIAGMLRQGEKDGAVRFARSHVEEALATGEADRITLAWANLAQTCAAVEDLPEAAKALEKAVAAIPGTDDAPALALPRFRCLLGLGQLLLRLERKGRSREALERSLVAAAAVGGDQLPRNRAMVAIPLGWLLLDAGEVDRALGLLMEARTALADGEPDFPNLVQALVLLGQGRVRQGEEHALLPDMVPSGMPMPALAQGFAAHLQQLTERAGAGKLDPKIPRDLARWVAEWLARVAGKEARLTADTNGLLAALEGMCGRKDHQVEALEKAEKLYRLQGLNPIAARAARARAMVLAEKGDIAGAEGLLRTVAAEAREAGEDELFSEAAQGLAQVLHAGGKHGECERLLEESIQAADRVENLDLAAMGSLSLGVVLAHSDRMAQAQAHFRRALERIPAESQLHQVASVHMEAHAKGVPCPCDPSARAGKQAARQSAARPGGGESLFSPAYADMLKQMLPEDLANKLQSVMSKLPQPDESNMDPETARMIREMEARTMQRLQGMMGMMGGAKKPE